MKGKKTNIFLGILNIILGLLLIMYVWYMLHNNKLELTRHQRFVMNIEHNIIFGISVVICFINFVFSIFNMKKGYYFVFYLFSLVGIITFFTPTYIYPIFTIISGILIIRTLSKNNYIEKDNFFASTIIIIMMGIIGLSAISLSQYKKIAEYIKKREDINLTAYNPEYFKYVEEIPDKSIYINVKLNGKYGYINKSGETKIDFKYDYATPFYKIRAYDKTFELAAVSTKNTTDVIMKNERKVMSYNSEYANEDHEGKRDEFVKILKDVIGEKNPELEVSNKYNGFATRNIYEDTKNSNEKRYQFTDKYDVLIQKSEITEKEIYTLVTKRDLLKNSKSKGDYIKLNAEQLIHDDNYLYVYNNGFLPYFSPSKKEQGWFNLEGKKYTLNNNVQIEVFEDKRLAIKRKPRKITYFASNEDEDLKAISPIYKEVIPDGDNYIVKNMNEKWQIVDKNFQPRTKLEYDIFISTLITEGIYIFANIDNGIEIDDYGYAKLKYTMIDRNLNVIGTNLEEMYNFNIKYLNRNSDEEYRRYIEKLKDPRYHRIVEKLQ